MYNVRKSLHLYKPFVGFRPPACQELLFPSITGTVLISVSLHVEEIKVKTACESLTDAVYILHPVPATLSHHDAFQASPTKHRGTK